MKNILIDINDGICTLTINRPKQLNALNIDVLKEFSSLLDSILLKRDVRAIILTGIGEKSFIAGADIEEMKDMNYEEAKLFSDLGQKLTLKIESYKLPIIAAINGYALGGGCEIAMACHIRYASKTSIFGQPEVGLGLIAGWGGTQRLPLLVGKGKAMELLITGSTINAQNALDIGLIDKSIDSNELLLEVNKLANKIKTNAPQAISYTISSINSMRKNLIEDSLKIENEFFAKLFNTNDTKEGIEAFLDKRKPKFNNK